MGNRGFTAADHCHVGTLIRVPANGLIHVTTAGHDAICYGLILARNFARLQRGYQVRLRRDCLGDDH
jgi:hypothetical protein